MNDDPSHRLLREHDRWMRFAWPLAILAAGLSAMLLLGWLWHPSWVRVEARGALAGWWLAGVAVTFFAAACVGLIRRKSLLRSARSLDARLAAKNRIETATALQGDPGALARAQREETAGFLRQAPVRPRRRLLSGLCLLVLVLFLAHFVTLLSWTRPWMSSPVPPSAKQPPASNIPKASIKWRSPTVETKAAPVEEVPLEAVADSTSGLRDLLLEVSVNGGPGQSVPVTPGDLGKPGKHTVQTSIYLDQLEVEPFDIVAYHLRARRIDPRALPETVSPVQFVQVKPFRDDVREVPGADGTSAFPLILALKSAQLRLMKENFLLAHTELSHESGEWKKQNTRVGGEQELLEQKTGEVIQRLIETGMPAEIVNLLAQARPMMIEAKDKILASANKPALAPQGKALGFITEVEKFFVKLAARDGSSHGPRSIEDPFRDKKQFELKQRFKTAAGELELLAREQARLADDIAKPDAAPVPSPSPADTKPDPNKIEGTPAERQTQISQRIGALLNGRVFVSDVTKHLEQGRGKARESLEHLDASDLSAAQEPAAAAARELRLAVAAMNKAAEDDAKDQLANALRELNNAADAAQSAPQQGSDEAAKQKAEEASKAADDAARKAAEAAQKQQETGSEKAAARLDALAKSLSSEAVRKRLEKLRQQPRDEANAHDVATRLRQLADRAAQPREDALSREQMARLLEKLERIHANMQRLVKNEASQGKVPEINAGKSPEDGKTPGTTDSRKEQPGGDKGGQQGKQEGAGPGGKPEDENGEGGEPGHGRPGQHGTSPGETSDREPADSGGNGTDGQGGTGGGRRERFARELIEDVRDGLREAVFALPKSEEIVQVLDSLGTRHPRVRYAAVIAYFSKIDPPLAEVIRQLRAELALQQRRHLLTDQGAEQAPAAYRAAVADYFEQLSRDYKSEPASSPVEEP